MLTNGLTTAEILYRMPDHPVILQSYIWQEYDLAPDFPQLRRSVTVGNSRLIKSAELKAVDREFRPH